MTTETMMSVLSPSVRGMPRFSALAEAVLRQAADLATLVSSLGPGFSLASAEGTQLDQLAASLGLFRADTLDGAAASDETFRAYLRAKLALWRWDGTDETVPAVLAEAFPGEEVSLTDRCDGTVAVSGAAHMPAAPEKILPVPAGIQILTDGGENGLDS